MNILIVSQYFWPESFRINELAGLLAERGHSVSVLTGLPNYPEGRFFEGYGLGGPYLEQRGRVRVLRAPLISRGPSKGARLALNYLSFAVSACVRALLSCRGRYDSILVFEPSPVTVGLPAVFLRALGRGPVLFWVQDLWPESLEATGAVRNPRVLGWIRRMVGFIYDRCDRILVQSQGFRPAIESFGIDPARIEYFPNSAEALYEPLDPDPEWKESQLMPATGFRILFAGNIGAAQDFETILGAASQLRDRREIQWIIVGDGRMKDWVEKEIAERGLARNVRLLGRFPTETMPRFFAMSDALLVTLKDEPIFALTVPSKIQSYLACGRPVVAALRGEGARVVEESGAGIAVAPENPEALAQAVLRLAALPVELQREMGARGRRYFEEQFAPESLVARLEGWMQKASGDQRRPA